ncbi:hypothetical protein Tco_1047029 [Tanacetum coccineum]
MGYNNDYNKEHGEVMEDVYENNDDMVSGIATKEVKVENMKDSPRGCRITVGLNPNKKSSFKFANHTTDKEGFIDVVKKGWDVEISEVQMFKLLEDIRCDIDKDPHNSTLQENDASILKEYLEAVSDEEKLLCQQDKLFVMKMGTNSLVMMLQGSLLYISRGFVGKREETNEEIKADMFDIDDNKAP